MLILSLKYVIKELLAFIVRLFGGLYLLKYLCRKQEAYFVFNYHNFSKYNNYKIRRGNILETGYAKQFDKQIKFFKKNFVFKYPAEFFTQRSKGISVLITFDDGYKDNYDIALPILTKHNAKAIFFVVSKFINTNDFLLHDKVRYLVQNKIIDKKFEDLPKQINKGIDCYSPETIKWINEQFKVNDPSERRMMNLEELNRILEKGFKIGNHTASHSGLAFLTYEEQYEEIDGCNEKLQIEGLNDFLAFPNGLFNNDTIKLCKELNVKYAFTTNRGLNKLTSEQFLLNRLGLNSSDSVNVLLLKMLYNYFFTKK